MKLFPVIVQDAATKDVLMLAYANDEALEKTRATGFAWFYSRSRKKLWKKGEQSRNTMRVKEIRWDCDQDTVLYQVTPAGPACHTGSETCFGDKAFSLASLEKIIQNRKTNPKPDSYTNQVLGDAALLNEKILEEAQELVDARTKDEVVWEAADVLYFTLVKLAQNSVDLQDVVAELERRNKRI